MFLRLSLVLAFLTYTHFLSAKTIYILDFDGTIINDSSLDSPWKTPWVLKKIDQVSNSAQLDPDLNKLPSTIQVSFAEYMKYYSDWGKGNSSIAGLKKITLPADLYLERPQVIIPGYYFADPNLTFQYYKASHNGANYLIDDYQKAKERLRLSRSQKIAFLGDAWDLFQHVLSDLSTVGNLNLFTARTQTQEDFIEFFKALEIDGLIKYSKGYNKRNLQVTPTIHNLQGPDSILTGRSLVEGKKNVVIATVKQLSNSSAEPTLDYSISDPSKTDYMHTVVIGEDDPNNISNLLKTLKELSYGTYTRKIKLVLFISGPFETVLEYKSRISKKVPLDPKNFETQARWIVFDQGLLRYATMDEINNYNGKKPLVDPKISSKLIDTKLCVQFLDGAR
jgi:hypothetical protein